MNGLRISNYILLDMYSLDRDYSGWTLDNEISFRERLTMFEDGSYRTAISVYVEA